VTDVAAVEAAIAGAHRSDWAVMLAATVRVARDLDLAEECVQESYASAMKTWVRTGIPDNPAAWLTTTARRRAIDAIRRDAALRSRLPLLAEPEEAPDEITMQELTDGDAGDPGEVLPDERLRLIFTCCHPALAQEAQVALTLRLVCGVPAPDIARAFLVSEPTMAARITRAKKKISTARIPFRVPRPAELPDRLRGVLAVIHLLFTTGHTAPSGASLVRPELVDRAMHLARMLGTLMPDEAEVRGLLALLVVTDARRATRAGADGRLVRLKDQDRSQWDRAALAEAHGMIVGCLRGGPPGRYVLQAAIASLYAEAPSYDQTDWPQIVALYDKLLDVWPSPVVALNRAVPLAMVAGPEAALAEIEKLERDGRLSGYQYLPAIKADLLSRLGRAGESAAAYRQALALAANETERAFLAEQVAGHTFPA
jgi:RNA polymerase sigma factor (sigma-70 family)